MQYVLLLPGVSHSIVTLRFIPVVGCMDDWFLSVGERCTVVMVDHILFTFSC